MASIRIKMFKHLSRPTTWVYISSSFVAISLLVVTFGLFRGFDWTDEAWAYSLTSSGRITLGEPWAFQYLMNPLLQIFGDHVIVIRMFRLFAFICLGILISLGFGVIAKSTGRVFSRTSWVILFSVTQIGTVLAWSWPPRYFAYNEITSVIVQLVAIAIGVVLLTARTNSKIKLNSIKYSLLWGAIGLITGILFYGRFTGFLLLMPIALAATLFAGNGRRLLSASLFTIFMGLGISVPIAMGLPAWEYAQSIWLNITDPNVQAANNHPSGLIQMYGENLWGMFLTVLPGMILALSGILISLSSSTGKELIPGFSKSLGPILFGVVATISLVYVIQSGGGAERTGKIAILSISLAAVATYIFTSSLFSQKHNFATKKIDVWRTICSVSLIAVAPIVASFGTNNPLTIHFGFDSTIWLGAAGLGLSIWYTAVKNQSNNDWLPVVSMFLLSSLAIVAIVGEARAPYRAASFKANSELISTPGPLQGLFVTPSEKNWLNWLNDQSVSLKAQEIPTLSLKSAGALLAFNNSNFASPWLESFWPASFWSISKACQVGVPKDLIVLVPGTVPDGSPEWNDLRRTLLESCDISFPEQFQEVADYADINPQYAMTIWRLK